MTDNSKPPSFYDGVLSKQHSSSENSGFLDKLTTVKQHLNNSSEKVRYAALKEALNYGQPGLDLVFEIVKTKTGAIQKSAFDLLLGKLVKERERIDREILELTTKYFPLGTDSESNEAEKINFHQDTPSKDFIENTEKPESLKFKFNNVFIRVKKVFSENLEVNPEEVSLETPIRLGTYNLYLTYESGSCYSSSGYHSSSYYHMSSHTFSGKTQENPLGIDELDLVELLLALEEEFKIEITDEEVENIKTIKELVEHIVLINKLD